MGGINSPDLARGLGRRFHEAAMRHDDRLTVGWDDLEQRQRDTYDAAAAEILAPIAEKWPRVKGRCPNCGHLTLILAAGGHVTCSAADCDDPGMADDLLGFAHWRGNEIRIARATEPFDSRCGEPYGGPEGDPLGTVRFPLDDSEPAVKVSVSAFHPWHWSLDDEEVTDDAVRAMTREWHPDVQTYLAAAQPAATEGDHAAVDDVVLREQTPRELGLTAGDGAAPSVQVRVGDVLHDAAALDLLPTFSAVRMLGGPFWLAEKAAVTDAWLLPGDDGDGATAEALVACGGVRVLDLPSDGGGR